MRRGGLGLALLLALMPGACSKAVEDVPVAEPAPVAEDYEETIHLLLDGNKVLTYLGRAGKGRANGEWRWGGPCVRMYERRPPQCSSGTDPLSPPPQHEEQREKLRIVRTVLEQVCVCVRGAA